MKKKYLLLLLCLPLLVTGCKYEPKLVDGKEVVVELNGKQFTAEEFFEELKDVNGTGVLINLVNDYITEQELTDEMKEESKKQAKAEYDSYKAYYGNDWNNFLAYYGFKNDDDLIESLENNYKQSLVLEKYLETDVIKEEEIQEEYDKNIYGESTIRHILIKPEVNDDMTSTEKEEEKRKALEEVTELIKQLQESKDLEKDFANLAKEKSDDTGTASEGGLLENITNESNLVEGFWEAVEKLEVGEMTTEAVETEFGYHIIYKVSQKEKPALDEVKDKVIDNLIDELLSEENASMVYWAGLREKYNMVIYDEVIKDSYDSTMKLYKKDK